MVVENVCIAIDCGTHSVVFSFSFFVFPHFDWRYLVLFLVLLVIWMKAEIDEWLFAYRWLNESLYTKSNGKGSRILQLFSHFFMPQSLMEQQFAYDILSVRHLACGKTH